MRRRNFEKINVIKITKTYEKDFSAGKNGNRYFTVLSRDCVLKVKIVYSA